MQKEQTIDHALRTLKSMEDKGLICREKNPEDGRSVLIRLTDLGKEKREISKASVYKFNQTIREHLDEIKIDHFFEVTETIKDLIRDNAIFKDEE